MRRLGFIGRRGSGQRDADVAIFGGDGPKVDGVERASVPEELDVTIDHGEVGATAATRLDGGAVTVLVEGTQVVESVEIHVEVDNPAGVAFTEADGLRRLGDVVLADDNLAIALGAELGHLGGSDSAAVEVVEAVDEVSARGVLGDAIADSGDVGAAFGAGIDGALEDLEIDIVGAQRGAPAVGQEAGRESAVMVSGVHVKGQSELLFVVEAGDPLGGALGCGQRRQQHASEDADDGHYH